MISTVLIWLEQYSKTIPFGGHPRGERKKHNKTETALSSQQITTRHFGYVTMLLGGVF